MSIYLSDNKEDDNHKLLESNIIAKLTQIMNKITPYELGILDTIIDSNKLEKLIEQQILRDNAKQEYEKTLSTIIEEFMEGNKNRYWYNKQNDTYYEYLEDNVKPINSDSIIIEITNMIPEEYYKNKNGFQRHLLSSIQNVNMVNNIKLKESTILLCRNILSELLVSDKYIDYLLITIGYSIYSNPKNNIEITNININNQSYNTSHHIWYGETSNDFLYCQKSRTYCCGERQQHVQGERHPDP